MKVTKYALRFIQRRIIISKDGCWVWTGEFCNGYARLKLGRKGSPYTLSRLMYMWFKGPLNTLLQIHHTCENKKCINPEHLEALTPGQHNATKTINYHNVGKTHCKYGHEFVERNTYIAPTGRRVCRKCNSIRQREWKEKSGGK